MKWKTPYTQQFFRSETDTSLKAALKVVPELLSVIWPSSVIDVGCGTGTWLSVFQHNGVSDVVGLDGEYVDSTMLRVDRTLFVSCDLSRPLLLSRSFDLAISLEVAEHLPARRSGGFVADLCALAPIVLFSAAIPGQGGTNHINEQWQSYWSRLFRQNRFAALECFGQRFWSDTDVSPEYAQNMVLYAAEGRIPSTTLHRFHNVAQNCRVVDVVHPHYWSNIGLRRIVNQLPSAVATAIRRRVK